MQPLLNRALVVALAGLAALPAAAIVNGTPVTDEHFARDFGWAVALESPVSAGVCTAVLISPSWILTAAHCAGAGWRVRIGGADRSTARNLAAVEAFKHPLYDARSGAYDVGLLRLTEPVDIAPVRLAGLADRDALLRPGARATIAGWGKRAAGLGHSTRLVVSDVVLAQLDREDSRFAYFDPVSGPCGGDSGGPLLLQAGDGRWLLVAIASRVVGDICAQGGGVGVYIDVAATREFIRSHVTDLPGSL